MGLKFRQMFPRKYLGAEELNDSEIQDTISRVTMENVGTDGQPEEKPVVYFSDGCKGLVLNVTNGNAIKAAYGDDTDGWLGKPLILFPSTTDFRGKVVACLRVKVPTPAFDSDAPRPQADSSIPF